MPPGYHVEQRIQRRVVVLAAGLLFTTYVFSAVAAATSSHEAPLWIPAAGPFIQIGQTSGSNSGGIMLLGLDGVFQTIGAAFLAYGLASPDYVLVRDPGPPRMSLAPFWLGKGAVSLGVHGTF